jgi:hypothetical protein
MQLHRVGPSGRIGPSGRVVPSARKFPGRAAWLVPLALCCACTGSITDPFGTRGDSPPGVGGNSPPPAPPPLPDSAPTTGPIASAPGPSSRFLRLSHKQWENTVRDLLRLPDASGLSKGFFNEGLRAEFDNQGADLEVTSQLWFDYNKAALALATKVVRDPKALAVVLPAAAGDPEARARTFIRNFGNRAYRRPLSDAEVDQHLGLYRQGATLMGSGDAFLDGLELVVGLFLQSPHFLYRTELGTEVKNGRVTLTDHEIAARLSYGLIGSMPDDQLFAAAAGAKLHNRDEVMAQARRLIDSPGGRATIEDLHAQLLRSIDPSQLVRDSKLHPHFVPGIGVDMRREALAFVDDVIVGQKQGLAALLTAPYTFVNQRLAVLYGVKAPTGATADAFARVDLDGTQRAGLYTQTGFLAMSATDFTPRPIKRGVTISHRVLCAEVPPPPPEVKSPAAPLMSGKTNRQAFEAATEMPGTICISCHAKLINPLGFAFENFDGMGEYRKDEKGLPIDASSRYEFTEGTLPFNGAAELMKTIAGGKQAHACYAGQLFEYLYGRPVTGFEQGLVNEIGRRSRLQVPIKGLFLDLVTTDAFLTRAAD